MSSPALPDPIPSAIEHDDRAAAGYVGVAGSVVGNLDGYGTAPALDGVTVNAYGTHCSASPPSPLSCPVLNTTTTGPSGNFWLNLSSGSAYYIAASPDASLTGPGFPSGFGGAVANVSVKNGSTVLLTVDPEVLYGNTSIVLPEYTCDSAYLNDFASGAGPGCQNPVLSWTQSGAYYLTSANELAFYSFVNRTLDNLTGWTPLYQDFPAYAMIPNDLLITQDGSYLYGWGTLTNKSTTITAEAVNVTTHERFEYNFTGVTTSSVRSNGQVQLTGWDGNDSQMTLILTNGEVIDHSLWSQTQRVVGTLDYYEANNVYWEPYLNGYINVQADGSAADGIEEWQLSGPTNLDLTRTYDGTWDSGIKVNGVNGIAFNVTSRELSVQAEWSGLTYAVNGTGALTTLLDVTNYYPPGSPPAVPIGPVSASDRSSLVAAGPMVNGNYEGFGNDSWLIRMTPGHVGFLATNVSPYLPNTVFAGVPIYSWVQWSQEGQFYNASYLIAPNSYACERESHGACAINGSAGGPVGTIWWMWQLGSPEFPGSATVGLADASSPPPTDITAARTNGSAIALVWQPPLTTPILNYTVAWGPTTDYTHFASVGPENDSFTIVGLAASTHYDFAVEAWNLHFHGSSDGIRGASTTRASYTVTFHEKGLPSQTPWNMSLGTSNASATNGTIKFAVAPGVYHFTVATPVSGTSTGSFEVNRSSVTVHLAFSHVKFHDSGLPSGLEWTLATNGLSQGGIGRTLSVYLLNGSYEYLAVPSDSQYLSASGAFAVNGTAETIAVAFSPAGATPATDPGTPSNVTGRAPTGARALGFGLGWGILVTFLTEIPRRWRAAPPPRPSTSVGPSR